LAVPGSVGLSVKVQIQFLEVVELRIVAFITSEAQVL